MYSPQSTMLEIPHEYLTENISNLLYLRSPNLRPVVGSVQRNDTHVRLNVCGSLDPVCLPNAQNYPRFDKSSERYRSYPKHGTPYPQKKGSSQPCYDDCLLLHVFLDSLEEFNFSRHFQKPEPFSSVSTEMYGSNTQTNGPPRPVVARRQGRATCENSNFETTLCF